MIKFFRKIRKKLLSENKFSKYLVYAIGEIFLVVIGILIALQLNNWNEERKIKNQERVSLERLHEESENIVEYLNNTVEYYESLIKAVERSAKALSSNTLDSLNEYDFAFGIYSTAFYEAIAPPKSVFEELNNTGKIQNISSVTTRERISNYYSKLEYITTQLDYFRNQYTNPVEAAGEGLLYKYEGSSKSKIRTSVKFELLTQNDIFISKHTKALRDLIVFNQERTKLLKLAQDMCQEISTALNTNCSSVPSK